MSLRKNLSLTLILFMILSSLIVVGTVYAQSIPKPSVPEFKVRYVDLSYDIPTTTSIDQYTGQTITHQGYHVENETLQLTIKNQPFTSYLEKGQNISFYYNVRERGHFSNQWIEFYSPDNEYPTKSRDDYSTITYVLGNSSRFGYTPPNSQIDFQVQALIGSVHRISNITGGNQFPWEMFPWVFDGQTSDWSGTQTVTIPDSLASTSPEPTLNPISSPSPVVPEFPSTIFIASLIMTTFALALVLRRRIHINSKSIKNAKFYQSYYG